jgi:hypothetical protein
MDMTPQGYPLVVTIGEDQHLVVGWAGARPVTVPLRGPGRPQARDDDDYDYTLPPQLS